MHLKHTLLLSLGLAIAAVPGVSPAQTNNSLRLNSPSLASTPVEVVDANANEEYFAVGTLQRVRRTDSGAVRMALLDENKEILAFIAPTARVELSDFVGQEVGISARTFSQQDDVAPYVMVEEIVPVSGANVPDMSLLSRLERAPVLQAAPKETGSGVQQASAELAMPATVDVWGPQRGQIVAPAGTHVAATCNDPSCQSCGGGYVAPVESFGYSTYDGCGGASCSLGCTDSCISCGPAPCGPPGWFWVRGEYLVWWADGMPLPPLITGSSPGTPAGDAGVLGESTTQILYGNEDSLDLSRSGFRIRFGGWFDQCRRLGWEADYFDLGDIDETFLVDGDTTGNPILARPFFNINLPGEDAQLISYPGMVTGSAEVSSFSRFNGASGRFRWNMCCKRCGQRCNGQCNQRCGYPPYVKIDLSLGYRYLGLDEGLTIQEELVTLDQPTNTFEIFDSFETQNDFNGGEIGTIWEAGWNRWTWEMATKTAIGSTRQQVSINGTTTTLPGDTFEGGFLAQRSNIGSYEQNDLSVIPELSTTLGFYLTPRLRVTVGYTIIYWSNVVRPGDQIDLDLNPDLLPPEQPGVDALRPEFVFRTTDFWAQGLNVGLDLHW